MPAGCCAYCGKRYAKRAGGRDHAIPACLYPGRTSDPTIPRITVPACKSCNESWSDDEPHFRDVMILASTANDQAREAWTTKTLPAFRQGDGKRRARELLQLVRPVEGTPDRFMVFPAENPRVLRIIRKAVRGLAHHHGLASQVPDEVVWADVLRYHIPPAFEADFVRPRTDAAVFTYRYLFLNEPDLHSAWVLTFYANCTFIAAIRSNHAPVSRSKDAA